MVEVSEFEAELQKMSSVQQGEQAQEPGKVQCFQVEEEPKSPQLLKKVQSTKTKSVGMESVEVKPLSRWKEKEGWRKNQVFTKSTRRARELGLIISA